jgi:hypothetical protein
MRNAHRALAAVAAGAVMLLGAQAASAPRAHAAPAKTIVDAFTYAPSLSGGKAAFRYGTLNGKRTHYLAACDYADDGYGVIAYVSYFDGARQNEVKVLNGAGRCSARSVAASANRVVYLVVCLYKGPPEITNRGTGCNQEIGLT